MNSSNEWVIIKHRAIVIVVEDCALKKMGRNPDLPSAGGVDLYLENGKKSAPIGVVFKFAHLIG